MSIVLSRTGSTRVLGCPATIASVPDGYTAPWFVDDVSNGLWFGGPWTLVGAAGAPAFLNSWVNFGAGWEVARYRKIGDVVYIEGMVKSGTVALPVFTLPVGYRPANAVPRATTSNGLFGQVSIDTVGNVTAAVGSNVWFVVACSFSVAP